MKSGKSTLELTKQEIKKWKRDKSVYYSLLSISLISLFLFLLFVSLHILELTGYSSYIASRAGYITEVSVTSKKDVNIWGGIYGFASGF